MPARTSPTTPLPFYSDQLSHDTTARLAQATPLDSPFAGADEALTTALAGHVEALSPSLRALAQELHADPETAFEEHRSAARLAAFVQGEGVDATVGVHGRDTAVRAEFTCGTGGRTIAILAEYDALPGVGHACGHNVICSAGAGAFAALHRLAQADPQAFNGRVVLLGTPGEEGHTGKEYMAREGGFDGLDAAIMLHPYGYDLSDQVWLGRRTCRVTFSGIPAHASAEPFMGRNALDAASLMYQGIGLLRQQMIPVDRVHAVITQGGTRASIITETAVVELYVRSKYTETLLDLSARVQDIAEGAALMAGVGVDIEWDQHPPSLPVRGNAPLTARWAKAQAARGRNSLPFGVVPESIAASTDFGNVSLRVPGIHPLIKIAEPDTALHTRPFAEAAGSEPGMVAVADGAYGLAATALDFLVDDDLAAAVRADFEAAGGAVDVENLFTTA